MNKICFLILLFCCIKLSGADAAALIVLDSRGGGLKIGQSIESEKSVSLKEGERVTVIGSDGKSITLRGPFEGQPFLKSEAVSDPKAALAALVATRDARTSSVGVIRAGTDAVKIPEPWLIDVTRPGPRCLQEGERPVLWRPDVQYAESFTVFPADRSWRADFNWQVGVDRMPVPTLSKFEGQNLFVIRIDKQEFGLSVSTIPKGIDNDLMLISWMLEKGCIQQADALIKRLRVQVGQSL